MTDFPHTHGKRWPSWVKPRLAFHGAPVGILMLDRMPGPGLRPYLPGDCGNATTWSVPVRYKTVFGLNNTCIFGPNDEKMTATVVEAATELVREGARSITAGCGYFIRYQEAVRAAVDVPVFLSSLLLAPFLEQVLPRSQSLGVIVASKTALSQDMVEAAGIRPGIRDRMVIRGLDDAAVFAGKFLEPNGDLDPEALEADVVDAILRLQKERPDLGMLLLECGGLPPYAVAVQEATSLPVFDFTSMVEFFIGGLTRKRFTGLL
ncbi:hypothetical protein [Mesorhizobium sp. M1329]|uniref:hypothetical protein n=1 Tax=Mesorhizobium sp. M1329 TaxID=2957083 RepID=UPI0033362744